MSYQDLKTERQNNEPLKRSDLLAAHGAGGLKLTTWGVVLVHAIDRWPLMKCVEERLKERPETNPEEQRKHLAVALETYDIQLVEDPRFVRFLRDSRDYSALSYLVSIPQIELSRFNTVKPSAGRPAATRDTRTPSAEHFPKYFYDAGAKSKHRHLRTYQEALRAFQATFATEPPQRVKFYFVPPRSAQPAAGPAALAEQAPARRLLEPVPLVLICPHGHLADVPWAKFLGAQHRLSKKASELPSLGPNNELFPELFGERDCCDNPQLLWQGAGLSSDSYAGAVLRCSTCKAATNLAQVSRLRPNCNGGRPWATPKAPARSDCTQPMQRALTTGNNLYYPLAYTGLYLPERLLPDAPADAALLGGLIKEYEGARRFSKGLTPNIFWETITQEADHSASGWVGVPRAQLHRDFLAHFSPLAAASTNSEEAPSVRLKRQEYEVFTGYDNLPDEADFEFRNVPLTGAAFHDEADAEICLSGRLHQVRRVDKLRLTRVQLAFTRVQPLDPDALDIPGQHFTIRPQRVHKADKAQVRVLPALVSRGEGIFLELNTAAVTQWEENGQVKEWCQQLQGQANGPLNAMQQTLAQQATPRQLLVHTLSHLLIRELEWKCGYPAASVQERLYVRPASPGQNDKGQAGLLLYATEGSQGSMGGLTHQARPDFIARLLRDALLRATDCPSDPICWYADAQAGSPLVRAACFACTMTSETSCELQNTLLDRRLLIDPDYGFFSSSLACTTHA